MKIACVKIKNFRSYKDEIIINFDNLTAFVGRNDIGKSTILEALDLFFNDGAGAVKIDKEDVNVHSLKEGVNETIIAVCFSELPDIVIIDDAVSTNLEDEYMLNSDGQLEIIKKYKAGGKASVFIKAQHPVNSKCSDLLLKKNSDLKNIIKSEGIECCNLSVNSEMRRAIWNHFAENLQLCEVEIDASKEDAKKILEKLSIYLPVYSLFQADRKNSDVDSEVQDPLKEAVRQIITEGGLKSEFTKIAERVLSKLQEVSDRTLEKLREIIPEAADKLKSNIPPADKLKWIDVFKGISILSDEDIPVNKRGSGIKRLVLLSFFRAEAERRAKEAGSNNGVIYAIEEPETSQHPETQRILIEALKKLSRNSGVQVIITTHSPFVVKELEIDNIRLIYEDESGRHISKAEMPVLQRQSLNEVIYIAFDEPTEEYHDELYSFIEYQKMLDDFKESIKCMKLPYIKINRDGSLSQPASIIISEYIRHQIHHPENHHNRHFTKNELRQSIKYMRAYIEGKNIGVIDNVCR